MRGAPRALELYPLRQDILFGGEKGAQTVSAGAGPGLAVDEAKRLEQAGVSQYDIFQQTGWYRGPDQSWKWILSDKGADLNQEHFTTRYLGNPKTKSGEVWSLSTDDVRKLPDVFKHPTLYQTYPKLQEATIERFPPNQRDGTTLAAYDPIKNKVYLGDEKRKGEAIESILHELQHGVQQIEGFGQGGNVNYFLMDKIKRGEPVTDKDVMQAYESYNLLSGEIEANQVEKQFETQNWSQLPTQMRGFTKPDDQLVRQPNNTLGIGQGYKKELPPADPSARWEPVDITPKWADEAESWVEHDGPDPFPSMVPIQATPQTPQAPGMLQSLRGYLSNSVSNLARIPGGVARALDWAGNNVALPYLQNQERLFNKDQSGQPLYGGVNERGEITGRAADLAALMMPAVAGGSPGGALSSGLRAGGPIRAYHSSPHDFDRFDMSKLGTGQGAQMYGRGLYFAESPAVSGRGGKYWSEFNNNAFSATERDAAIILREANFDRSQAISVARELYKWDKSPETLRQLELLESKQPIIGPRTYEVDIHADPAKLLDWDKPFSQQSRHVQDRISGRTNWTTPDMPGGAVYGGLIRDNAPISLSKVTTAPGHVARELNEMDIPGIRYLDADSRAAGGGTSNYVIFNDKLIDLRRKYAVVPPGWSSGLSSPAESAQQSDEVYY